MDFTEATTQIVKTAIENNVIAFSKCPHSTDEASEKQNAFNCKQITDFIAEISAAMKKAYKTN